MTTLSFQAIPLTPIHIGNGDTLAPEDYLIQGDRLIRFNRAAVLRDMNSQQRQQLAAALDKNQLGTVQELLRKACDPTRHALVRVQIGDESRQELDQLVRDPSRSCHVHPFVNNPLDGSPYLPGSSLKGAIRTALVNHFSQQNQPFIAQRLQQGDPRKRWQVLETEALKFQFGKMEGDPLRLLKVADAQLPADSTRIDRALHWKRGSGGQEGKIQLHYERLLCRGDSVETPFPVEIELDEQAGQHPAVRELLGQHLNFDLIRTACNQFYTGRMKAEQAQFFSNDHQPEQRYGAQGLLQFKDGKLLVARSIQEKGMLLRVGRFCQFESLSVDGLREGWNIQKKKPITEGSSRTLCRCRRDTAGESLPLPFGWLLLRQEN